MCAMTGNGTSQYLSLGTATVISRSVPLTIMALVDSTSIRTSGNFSGIIGQGDYGTTGGMSFQLEISAAASPLLVFSTSQASGASTWTGTSDSTGGPVITPNTGWWLVASCSRHVGANLATQYYAYRYNTGTLTTAAGSTIGFVAAATQLAPPAATAITAVAAEGEISVTDWFPGGFAWCGVWNADLSETQNANPTPIWAAISEGPLAIADSTLAGLWILDNSDAHDYSANAHNGTYQASPTFIGTPVNYLPLVQAYRTTAVAGAASFTGTIAMTPAVFVSAMTGTSTPPPVTGTMASTPGVFVSAMTGTSTPPPVTGTMASAPGVFVSVMSGASTPPGTSGTIAAAPAAFVSAMAGTSTPPPVSGTITAAPAAFTSAMTGTSTPPPVSGTMATAPAVFVSAMTGSVGGAGTTKNTNIEVGTAGSGGVDVSHAIVRDSANRLWTVSFTASSYSQNPGNQLRLYRADQTGVPATFTEQDTAHRPANVTSMAMAIDGSDLIHVAWVNGYVTPGSIQYNTFNTTTNLWGTAASIGTLNSASTTDQIVGDQGVALTLDSAGKPHVVHYGRITNTSGAYHIWYTNKVSGAWSGAVQLDSAALASNFRCMHPQIIALDDGSMLAAWITFDFNYQIPSDGTLYVAKRSTGGVWGTAAAFADTLLGSVDNGPSLFQSDDHTVHLVYNLGAATTTQSGNNNVVKYQFSSDRGATWNATRQPARFVTHDPVVGPDGAGGVYIWCHSQPQSGGTAAYDGLGPDLGRMHLVYGTTSWTAWTQFSTNGISSDGTVSVRWSQFFHNFPATVDASYFADALPLTNYAYSEITGNATGTITTTPGAFVSAMTGTSTPPSVTGTIAATPAAFVSAMSGQSAEVGTIALTPAPFVSVMTGTSTPPAVTGTMATTPAAFASSMTGTSTPPAVTGTMAQTPGAFVSAMSGTFTAPGANSGTIAMLPAVFVAALSGTVAPPNETGTITTTPGPFVAVLSGTSTPPPVSGTMADHPAAFVSVMTGTSGPPVYSGTIIALPGPMVMAAVGTVTAPPTSGTLVMVPGVFVTALTGSARSFSSGTMATAPGPFISLIIGVSGTLVTLGTVTLTAEPLTTIALTTEAVTTITLTTQAIATITLTITDEEGVPMNTYILGNVARLNAIIKDITGINVDAGTATVKAKPPSGTFTPVTPTHDALGVYHYDYDLDLPETHALRVETTNPKAAAECEIWVEPSLVA